MGYYEASESPIALCIGEVWGIRSNACDKHMSIRLMPNVEQKTIMRRIDKRMNRQYDFNRTKARSNMTTRLEVTLMISSRISCANMESSSSVRSFSLSGESMESSMRPYGTSSYSSEDEVSESDEA